MTGTRLATGESGTTIETGTHAADVETGNTIPGSHTPGHTHARPVGEWGGVGCKDPAGVEAGATPGHILGLVPTHDLCPPTPREDRTSNLHQVRLPY